MGTRIAQLTALSAALAGRQPHRFPDLVKAAYEVGASSPSPPPSWAGPSPPSTPGTGWKAAASGRGGSRPLWRCRRTAGGGEEAR